MNEKSTAFLNGCAQIVEKLMFFYNLFYFHRNDDG